MQPPLLHDTGLSRVSHADGVPMQLPCQLQPGALAQSGAERWLLQAGGLPPHGVAAAAQPLTVKHCTSFNVLHVGGVPTQLMAAAPPAPPAPPALIAGAPAMFAGAPPIGVDVAPPMLASPPIGTVASPPTGA